MVDYQVPHRYTRGCPTVIANVYDGTQRAMARVDLTGCPDEIVASVERDPADPSGYTSLLTWDNGGEGTVSIRWDSGTLHTGQTASGTMSQVYEVGQEGTHTVIITDEDDPNRNLTITFEVPLAETLDLTIKPEPSDPTGYTALAIWGPTGGPTPPGELDITIGPDAGDATGYTAVATWTTGGTP
jgi:hypothetical protein